MRKPKTIEVVLKSYSQKQKLNRLSREIARYHNKKLTHPDILLFLLDTYPERPKSIRGAALVDD